MENFRKKIRVGVIGSGNIGTDLLIKIMRSPFLTCSAFIGRRSASEGIEKAKQLGIPVSTAGIDYIIQNPDSCDIVFDASSATGHQIHAPILEQLGKFAVDLTPCQVGSMCIPAVNMDECLNYRNVNMVTCGGQASIPIVHAIAQAHEDVEYIEVVSSIASRSAGPATRINLDEYIHTTEKGIIEFSGVPRAKAILNLNPANPSVNMQTTVFAKIGNPNIEKLKPLLDAVVQRVKSYVPGYQLVVGPSVENGRLAVMVKVTGLGDYLPSFAGNLDIINCAAVAIAERYAMAALAKLPDLGVPLRSSGAIPREGSIR